MGSTSLYKQVLDLDLGSLHHVRARRPERLPMALAPEEGRWAKDIENWQLRMAN